MKRFRGSQWTLATLVTGLVVVSCGSGSGGSTSSETKALVFGEIYDAVGVQADYSLPAHDGLRFAVKRINDAGGVKVGSIIYKIDLKSVDARSTQQGAVAAATQLIQDDGVKVIFGPLGSEAPPVAQLTTPAHVLQFTTSSSVASLAGTAQGRELFIDLPTASIRSQVAASAVKKYLPSVKNVDIVSINDAAGQVIIATMEKAFKASGYTVQTDVYPAGTTDISTVITRVASHNPDLIVTGWSGTVERQKFFGQLAPAGIGKNVGIVDYGGILTECTDQAGGRPCIIVSTGYNVQGDDVSASVKQFRAEFLKFTGQSQLPTQATTIPYFYDTAFALVDAIKHEGTTTDALKLADRLRKTSYTGVFGAVAFGEDNALKGSIPVIFAKDGKQVSSELIQ